MKSSIWRSIGSTGVALSLIFGVAASAENTCRSVFLSQLTAQQIKNLDDNYGIKPDQVLVSPNMKIPIILRGRDHKTLAPEIPKDAKIVRSLKEYDVVVVGGGPAGMTSALYLLEAGHKVMIIERNEKLGGLGRGSELKGVRAGGGAAYSAGPDGGLQYKIFQKIGLGNYKKLLSIEEPIDSYLWKGKLHKHVFDEHTLKHLPASFTVFKHALIRLVKLGAGDGNTEFGRQIDNIDMATLVRQIPERMTEWVKDTRHISLKNRQLYSKLLNDLAKDRDVSQADPMKDVLDLLDLYGRSALGEVTNKLSARQFIDFYESEISTRYTGSLGTGTVVEALHKKLDKYILSGQLEVKTSASVARVDNTENGAYAVYENGDHFVEVRSKKMIFGASMDLVPKLIPNLAAVDAKKARVISQLSMSDYAVHVVRVKGDPFPLTYDTWVYSNGSLLAPTDYIHGRWQDWYRNGKIADGRGVLAIYQPLVGSDPSRFTPENNMKLVEYSVQQMYKHFNPLVEKGHKIEVELVESFRWPHSIHVVTPGYLKLIPDLARVLGNIHFANNSVAAPELESAMERGAMEAMEIIKALRASSTPQGVKKAL